MSVHNNNKSVKSVDTGIVLLDVEKFSLMSSKDQAKAAVVINGELESFVNLTAALSGFSIDELVAGFVPTGDGFFVILQHSISAYAIPLAVSLRSKILIASKHAGNLLSGIRLSTHYGELTEFFDITGKNNYVGPVMNECARLQYAKPEQAPDGFLTDSNYIICSPSSKAQFNIAYDYENPDSYFRNAAIELKFSDWINVKDKHKIVHSGAFIECSRNIGFNPPRPPDFDERMQLKYKKLVEEYRA